jgi:hypothetical protein
MASGAKAERVGLDEALSYIRPGDSLVVWRLDRLGRSLRHLIETITGLANRQVGFKSITESIDTTTSGGKLVFHIFGALAEFERDIIRELRARLRQQARCWSPASIPHSLIGIRLRGHGAYLSEQPLPPASILRRAPIGQLFDLSRLGLDNSE